MPRKNLHVRLSEEAWEGWGQFAQSHGVSITALAEVIGRRMAGEKGLGAAISEQLAREARQIDRDHRSRTDGG